ncbi:MAG: hypothetical protein ACC661_10975, partial [Verrucomicrobiales bacterium]
GARATPRWGTNITTNAGGGSPTTTLGDGTVVFRVDFDEPATNPPAGVPPPGQWLSSNEGQGGTGDSGGGLWTLDGSAWELSGVMVAIGRPSTPSTPPALSSVFGDVTYSANIASYRDSIIAIMIPEPSSALYLAVSMLLAGGRRPRRIQVKR